MADDWLPTWEDNDVRVCALNDYIQKCDNIYAFIGLTVEPNLFNRRGRGAALVETRGIRCECRCRRRNERERLEEGVARDHALLDFFRS
jgi:hypothetical protein